MMNLPQSQSRTRLVSPLSMESNDSNFLGQYQKFGGDAYSAAVGRTGISQHSPPLSQHASGSTDNSLSSRPSNRSPSASNGHMSSSSSLARSSDGAGFYSPSKTEFGRPQQQRPRQEDALQEHYNMLKNYLMPYLRGEAGANRPTKARDKLLRLSPTQFHELSTDVYDELLRREDDRRRPGGVVPPFLPPKNSFHPKRNQARQKLSTLPAERFRQLATDVFFELERRIPRFVGAERSHSPSGSVASSFRAPSRQGPPNGMPPRQNSQPNGFRGGPPPGMRPNNALGPGYQSYSPQDELPPRLDSRSRSDSSAGSYGRPLPKTFQSSTMVPNKSTMVEDDDSDEEEDGFGLEKVVSGLSKHSANRSMGSEKDREIIRDYATQVAELQDKISELEERLRTTEAEAETNKQRRGDHEREKDEWSSARADLGTRLAESLSAMDSLHAQLEQAHQDRSQHETDLRAETERTLSDMQLELDDMKSENETFRMQAAAAAAQPAVDTEELNELREQLARQRQLTDEVRNNAAQFLQEMRLLSEQSELAMEKEEQLRSQIASLEVETEEWKGRYTKAKTQLRSLRASSMGLSIQQNSSSALSTRQELLSDKGLVHDTDVTAYQISIDELLHAAREASPETLMHKAKNVVGAVRNITAGTDGAFSTLPSPQSSTSTQGSPNSSTSTSALKAYVSRNANYLVSAARTHATASGLAPMSLLDAAANNLTASVIEFLKAAGIKPSTNAELNHEIDVVEEEEGFTEIAPLSTNKSAAPVLKAPVPPQKGWFSMLKRESSAASDDDDEEYDYS